MAFGLGGVRGLLMWMSQSLVLGVGLGLVGRWVLLCVGPRHSWLRAWLVALLVGLPFRPSGVSGGPAPLLAEGCLLLWGFLCCVRLWCGRCSRFCVLCMFVGLVLVATVVVCVVCAQRYVWCVCGAFGCLSSPLWASVGGSVWVRGLFVVVPRPPWLWGLGVVFLVHGGCPPVSITQKRPNHGQVSVHGEPKFIEGQQPYVQ